MVVLATGLLLGLFLTILDMLKFSCDVKGVLPVAPGVATFLFEDAGFASNPAVAFLL